MAALRLVLFGRVEIYLNEQPIEIASLPDKGVALLCYLALTGTMHRRTTLAGLLWGNKPEQRARNNLSIVLNKLGAICDFLKVERREVGWDIAGDSCVDVTDFERCATQLAHQSLGVMQQSADLYRASLLHNFHLADEDGARDFLAWLQTQQTRLEQLARHLFHTLTIEQLEAGEVALAIAAARREMEIDRWREEAHRQLIQLYDHVGQRAEAIAQFKQCQQILRDELGVAVSAETRQLYDDICAGKRKPLRTRSVHAPFEAPALPAHFVGRTTLTTTIHEQLQASSQRICAFVGMGGIGKTTLATFLAHQWRDDFPDGVLWAHAADEDLLHLLGRWGERFGRDLSHLTSTENRAAVIRDLLVEKRVLLVFDNLSHVDKLRALIPASGASVLLITTRQHDIASALDALVIPVDLLSQADGVALLREILGERRVAAEQHAAATICQQLECLPLALEIVAQRLRTRQGYRLETLSAQLAALQSRLSELAVGDRAVRTSFELSWEMLSADLQSAFCHLAVFAGRRFTPAAFSAVHQHPFADIALEDLSALSLLTPLGDQRYRQHALLADFAYEKANDLDRQQQHMVAYYAAYAERHAAEPTTLQADWLNLVAAVHTAHDCANWQHAITLTTALSPNFAKLGRYSDARTLLPLACTAADHLKDPIHAAHARHSWGIACIEQNDYAEALPLLETAHQLAQAHDDTQLASDVMLDLARIGIERGEYEEAHQWLIEAQAIKEQLGDRQGLGMVHYRMARLYLRNGDLRSAENHCQRAIHYQYKKYPEDHVRSLKTQALLLIQGQAFQRAYLLSEQAVNLARPLNNTDLIASSLYVLFSCAIRCDDFARAETIAVECLQAYEVMGATKGQGLLYYEWSNFERKRSQPAAALKMIDHSIQFLSQANASYSLVYALWQQGIILNELARTQEARSALEKALEYARSIKHPKTIAIQTTLRHI